MRGQSKEALLALRKKFGLGEFARKGTQVTRSRKRATTTRRATVSNEPWMVFTG